MSELIVVVGKIQYNISLLHNLSVTVQFRSTIVEAE